MNLSTKKQKEQMHRYYETHKEALKQRRKEYRLANKEKVKEDNHRYYLANPDKFKQYRRKYIQAHRQEHAKRGLHWYYSNKERALENSRKWKRSHPHSRHHTDTKSRSKRERGLPTNTILAKPFEGSHLHHLKPDLAIYIPDYIHQSVYHNIWTGQGMREINSMAWAFYQPEGEILPI